MPKSYHIFYFPFIVKHDRAENFIVNALNAAKFEKLWKRAFQEDKEGNIMMKKCIITISCTTHYMIMGIICFIPLFLDAVCVHR